MDCPSEERLIRMALDGADGLHGIGIDLAARTVTLHHAHVLAAQVPPPVQAWEPGQGRSLPAPSCVTCIRGRRLRASCRS